MAIRGHNEGTIFKRKSDGRWVAMLYLGRENGKVKRKVYYGASRKEAEGKMSDGRESLKKGIAPVIGKYSLGAFLQKWLDDCVKPAVKYSTWVSYDQQIRRHIGPALGSIDLSKLTPQHVQQYLNSKALPVKRAGKDDLPGLGPKTIKYHCTILVQALKRAEKWGMVPRNVAMLVDAPRVPKHEVEPLTVSEASVLMVRCDSEAYGTMFKVALSLGLRKGEVVGLRWQDVDFDNATLSVRYQITGLRQGGKLIQTELKTKKSRRLLRLPAVLAAALKAQRTAQLELRMKAGDKWIDNGLVFTNSLGGPVDPRNVNRQLTRILKESGLRHVRVHDLRHSCASILHALGEDVLTISHILGHSSISVTGDIYTHVFAQTAAGGLDKLDAMLAARG